MTRARGCLALANSPLGSFARHPSLSLGWSGLQAALHRLLSMVAGQRGNACSAR